METNYKELSKQARLKVLEMIYKAGTSHIASNFSIIDIATVLYANLKNNQCKFGCATENQSVFNCYPHNCECKLHPNHPKLEQDEVVWSAGWKAATIYYFLAQQGKIPKEDLGLFGKEVDGKVKYLGLVETTTPGIHCNAGSMGHGLPIAVGMALAKKLKGEEGKVYCIMSDGEMNEGTTWESAMFASHHKLDNLVVIVDANGWQAMGRTNEILSPDLDPIWSANGWLSIMVKDGHNHQKIENLLVREVMDKNSVLGRMQKPKVMLCNTIKGKGVSFMEDSLLYHYKHVDEDTYKLAKSQLELF